PAVAGAAPARLPHRARDRGGAHGAADPARRFRSGEERHHWRRGRCRLRPARRQGMNGIADREAGSFPTSAGILLGLGLGGFFDGIVLHQLLQWHHMATSAGYPATSVENLELNTLLDGLFHGTTYVFVAAGL